MQKLYRFKLEAMDGLTITTKPMTEEHFVAHILPLVQQGATYQKMEA